MHRFRKRSDAKTHHLPPIQTQPIPHDRLGVNEASEQSPPLLPSAEDFRTSLILPDLSRRFSFLRNSEGDPLSVDALKTKLANQRARGAENHITEEEEDMILATLGLRSRTPVSTSAERSQDNLPSSAGGASVNGNGMDGARSSNTASLSSPRSKRYSNQFFGSGRLREYSYNRMKEQRRKETSSVATTESSSNTPIQSVASSLTRRDYTSNNFLDLTPGDTSPSSPDSASNTEQIIDFPTSQSMSNSMIKRASLALQEAIREMEEDAEDEIVMPRSMPIPRSSLDQHNPQPYREPSDYESGMAISSDTTSARNEDRMSPILSRIAPGYVPGMPRPMTPREDSEHDLRSHSTTPRANPVSPGQEISNTSPPNTFSSLANHTLPSFSSPRPSPRPLSPPSSSTFLQRKTSVQNGGGRPGTADSEAATAISGEAGYAWRRPSSPLAGSSQHQPMALNNQRPSTPSNVTWTYPANKPSPQKSSSHSRNGSWFSDNGAASTDTHGTYESSKIAPRSLRSPALPDSPTLDHRGGGGGGGGGGGHTNMLSFSSTYNDNRPSSPMSGLDLGQPFSASFSSSRIIRSPTPTQSQSPSRSPTSPAFSSFDLTSKHGSRRSSKQNTSNSSPYSFPAFNPIVFSPIASSSRSSLSSTGSSYHSGDGDRDAKDRLGSFLEIDLQQPAWHDLSLSFPGGSSSSQSNSDFTTPGDSPNLEYNAEGIITRYAGLNKADITAIQEKLFGFAAAKTSVDSELRERERVPSLRRRRPSTSQSNYSFNGRIASPPPQHQGSNGSLNQDQLSRASALLKSVVDSIQTVTPPEEDNNTNPAQLPPSGTTDHGVFTPEEVSPVARRTRDLAQILFGDDDSTNIEETLPTSSSSLSALASNSESSTSTSTANSFFPEVEGEDSTTQLSLSLSFSSAGPSGMTPTTPTVPYTLPSKQSSNLTAQLQQQQGMTDLPQTDLALEVQRKAEAAMLALKKQEGSASSLSLPRKRIAPHQISSPTLVSASTSVDTIPLRSPPISGAQTSKLGSRFKKLRGTLRKGNNNAPTGEEVTPYPLNIQVSTSPQHPNHSPPNISPTHLSPPHPSPALTSSPNTPKYDLQKLHPIEGTVSSAVEGQFHIPVTPLPLPSPPASAGPGLKGFMARFRGKQRAPDGHEHRELHLRPGPVMRASERAPPPQTPPLSAPAMYDAYSSRVALPQASSSINSSYPSTRVTPPELPPVAISTPDESAALRQLFDAASNLGLDQQKLNDLLLVRSGSTSSRSTDWTMPTRKNSTATSAKEENQTLPLSTPSSSHQDDPSNHEKPISRKPSTRQPAVEGQGQPHRIRERTIDPTSVIVRRTIFFPSDAPPKSTNLQSKSSIRRKRASGGSIASKNPSIYDRQPTPPPRSPTAKRFSTETSPPMPQLPHYLTMPHNAIGGTGHDSFYDMYTDENSRGNTSEANPRNTIANGAGLEIIELANGETIWQIVNELRDDDESIYTGRSSFASEYDNEENVQLTFKEHARSGSKGSASSFFSRKKSLHGKNNANRPETKVFFSSSAQIGRLIENLSTGMDAGHFNILPGSPPPPLPTGHSNTSSISDGDTQWTVEERLERMLGRLERGET